MTALTRKFQEIPFALATEDSTARRVAQLDRRWRQPRQRQRAVALEIEDRAGFAGVPKARPAQVCRPETSLRHLPV